MENRLLIFSFVFIFCMGLVSSATTSYTPTTTTDCHFGLCTKTIYSGIQNVLENDKWIDVDKVVSLKDKGILEVKFLEDDINYPLEVLDYNTTSITLDLKHWSLFNDEIDLRIWKQNSTQYFDYLNIQEKNKKDIHNKDYKCYCDKVVSEKIVFNIFDLGSKVSIYNVNPGDIIEFGPNSTTITLQTPDTENLEDTWINEGNPDYTAYGNGIQAWIGQYESNARHLVSKFDVSSLNSSITILNANQTYYVELNNLDSGETMYFSPYQVFQPFNWVESGTGVLTWNTRPTGAEINSSYDSLSAEFNGDHTGSVVSDITNMISASASNGDANLTIYMGWEPGTGFDAIDQVLVGQKESGTAAYRPKIEITYSTDTCTYVSGTWEVNCADNCTITSAVDLGGNDITIDGAGTFTITGANITNFGNGLVKGINSSSQCVVRCLNGGCLNF